MSPTFFVAIRFPEEFAFWRNRSSFLIPVPSFKLSRLRSPSRGFLTFSDPTGLSVFFGKDFSFLFSSTLVPLEPELEPLELTQSFRSTLQSTPDKNRHKTKRRPAQRVLLKSTEYRVQSTEYRVQSTEHRVQSTDRIQNIWLSEFKKFLK